MPRLNGRPSYAPPHRPSRHQHHLNADPGALKCWTWAIVRCQVWPARPCRIAKVGISRSIGARRSLRAFVSLDRSLAEPSEHDLLDAVRRLAAAQTPFRWPRRSSGMRLEDLHFA